MEFKKEDLQDWVFENHDKYWETHLRDRKINKILE